MDPSSLPPTRAPSLPELHATIKASLAAYPELQRSLRHALRDVEQRLGIAPAPTSAQRHDRERLD